MLLKPASAGASTRFLPRSITAEQALQQAPHRAVQRYQARPGETFSLFFGRPARCIVAVASGGWVYRARVAGFAPSIEVVGGSGRNQHGCYEANGGFRLLACQVPAPQV